MSTEQYTFPFYLDEDRLKEFLTRWLAIEDEQDRLREELRLLKEAYKDDCPMRGVLAAVKIVRTRRKLANHPKEPMLPVHLEHLVDVVERHMSGMEEAIEALQELAKRGGQLSVPDMSTGEVR